MVRNEHSYHVYLKFEAMSVEEGMLMFEIDNVKVIHVGETAIGPGFRATTEILLQGASSTNKLSRRTELLEGRTYAV